MSALPNVRQVIYDHLVDHPMWIGDDGRPLDYLPEREARICDFLDSVTEALRPEAAA